MNKYKFVAVMLTVILAVSIVFTNLYVKWNEEEATDGNFTVVTSFYPMYIACANLMADADEVTLKNLSEPQTGCLHDYQLTPEDMKLLSTADLFVVNGGGIESFLADVASAYPDLMIAEACREVCLLGEEEHEEEEHEEEEHEKEEHTHSHGAENAHAWMSLADYEQMIHSIAQSLIEADPKHRDLYEKNEEAYCKKLAQLQERQQKLIEAAAGIRVILFHEAYAYVAEELELTVSMTMDLDEERQVSAGEVADVLAQIREGSSLILAEELYAADMADTITKETDQVTVLFLDPLTRGEMEPDAYLRGMEQNLTLLEQYFKVTNP